MRQELIKSRIRFFIVVRVSKFQYIIILYDMLFLTPIPLTYA